MQQLEAVQATHREANDRLAALQIALEDLDAQVAKFESEIDAVRQREDRDRSLLASGSHRRQAAHRAAARAGDAGAPPVQPGGLAAGGDGAPGGAAGPAGRRAGEDRRAAERAGRGADGRATTRAPRSISCATNVSRGATNSSRSWTPIWLRCTNVSGPAAGRVRGCCRVAAAVPAGSRSTAASWRGSPPPPRTRCCAARSAVQSCCGSREPASEGHRRGRRRVAW